MNLHPAGSHLLDTSAVIILARLRMVAAPDALVGFATLGELSVGIARARNPRREEERMRPGGSLEPAAALVGEAGNQVFRARKRAKAGHPYNLTYNVRVV